MKIMLLVCAITSMLAACASEPASVHNSMQEAQLRSQVEVQDPVFERMSLLSRLPDSTQRPPLLALAAAVTKGDEPVQLELRRMAGMSNRIALLARSEPDAARALDDMQSNQNRDKYEALKTKALYGDAAALGELNELVARIGNGPLALETIELTHAWDNLRNMMFQDGNIYKKHAGSSNALSILGAKSIAIAEERLEANRVFASKRATEDAWALVIMGWIALDRANPSSTPANTTPSCAGVGEQEESNRINCYHYPVGSDMKLMPYGSDTNNN